jgi:hypothetical protein
MSIYLCEKKQYVLDVRVLEGDFMGEGYQTNSLPWMAIRTSVREVFNKEAHASR